MGGVPKIKVPQDTLYLPFCHYPYLTSTSLTDMPQHTLITELLQPRLLNGDQPHVWLPLICLSLIDRCSARRVVVDHIAVQYIRTARRHVRMLSARTLNKAVIEAVRVLLDRTAATCGCWHCWLPTRNMAVDRPVKLLLPRGPRKQQEASRHQAYPYTPRQTANVNNK